jgi:anti-sigma factor RsiW
MTAHDHERAIDLITRQGTEEMSAATSAWLESHLETCTECAEYSRAFAGTERLLRAVAVTASPALVMSTQERIRARAAHLQEQRTRTVLMAISFAIGALSSTLSAWLWWMFGGWVAQHVGLPSGVVQPGILLFLILPAIVIALLLLAFPHPSFESSLMTGLTGERQGEKR